MLMAMMIQLGDEVEFFGYKSRCVACVYLSTSKKARH